MAETTKKDTKTAKKAKKTEKPEKLEEAETVKAEEVPKKQKKSKEEEPVEEFKAVLTRVYTIPLRKQYNTTSKAKDASKRVRSYIEQHIKPTAIYIDPELNEKIWKRGYKKSPASIRVSVEKNKEGLARVSLRKSEE
ncbi:TPA: 60S ribosomal protein L31 [archaeon]|nr:60S ribosomal protein L31 [Candidatus Undinarchaeales archaeon SRR5007147.bin71]